jgi:type II secretory pathway pseudopilin PulG
MLTPRRPLQRGMSLVELMVGIAIGMFVVAAATLVVTTQLGENRRLLLETQLQQDMRATADIIARELRRSGSVGDPPTMAADGIWLDGKATVTQNSFTEIDTDTPGEVQFRYRRGPGRQGPFGFKLEDGAIKTLLNEGTSWQELTDSRVMRVTGFTVTPQGALSLKVPCPKLCPDGDTACWPTVEVRSYVVAITASATNDAAIERSISSRVRVRNEWLKFNDADHPLDVCPA